MLDRCLQQCSKFVVWYACWGQ